MGLRAVCGLLRPGLENKSSRVSFVGTKAPRRRLSSEVVCPGGLTGKWPACPRLACLLLAFALENLDVPQTFLSFSCGVDQEGSPLLFPPWLAMLKATFVFSFLPVITQNKANTVLMFY